MIFIPNSPHERHQKYFDAFSIKDGLTDSKYMNYITQYIFDPCISPDNEEDIYFFKDLLFESIKGKVHISYYDWVISHWSKCAFVQSIETLARYSLYISRLSELFVHDFFNYLWQLPNKEIIVQLFPKLDHVSKLMFISWADTNPEIITLIPKLKLYLLFT